MVTTVRHLTLERLFADGEENTPLLKQINACRKETPDPDLQATITKHYRRQPPVGVWAV